MELAAIVRKIQGEAHVYDQIQRTRATGLHSQHKSLQKSLQKLLAYFITGQKVPSQEYDSSTHHITYLGENRVGIVIARPAIADIEAVRCREVTDNYQQFVRRCKPLEILVKSYLKAE